MKARSFSLKLGILISEIIAAHSIQEEKWKQFVSKIMATALGVSQSDDITRSPGQKWKAQSFLARQVIAVYEDALSFALVLGIF